MLPASVASSNPVRNGASAPRGRNSRSKQNAVPTDPNEIQDYLRRLNERALSGDASAVVEIRAFLDQHPDIVKASGNAADQLRECLVVELAGRDIVRRECINREIEQLRDRLRGPAPTDLENLQIDIIVISYLELLVSNNHALSETEGGGAKLPALRKMESAQKRYDAAVKGLTRLRTLAARARRAARKRLPKEDGSGRRLTLLPDPLETYPDPQEPPFEFPDI